MTTYYISPTGSDGNNGLTPGAAFATFAFADSVVVAGDTVRVLPGTYYFAATSVDFDNLDTHPNGTQAQHITWISDTLHAAKMVSIGASGGGATVFWRAKGNWTDIIGFEIFADPINVNMAYGISVEGSNCTVHDNIIHDMTRGVCSGGVGGAGIYIGNPTFTNTNVDVYRNFVYNIGPSACLFDHCIYFTISGGNVYNNICINGSGTGIHLNHGACNMSIFNNLCYNNGNPGISTAGMHIQTDGLDGIANVTNVKVFNNLCINNKGVGGGIWSNSGDLGTLSCVYTNNNCFGNQTAQMNVATGFGTLVNNISLDPLFAGVTSDALANFRLTKNSPMIGAGILAGAPSTDFDGNARGPLIDIGPYQFTPKWRGGL